MTRRGLQRIVPGLESISRVLGCLGNPERHLGRVVLISGTNGKGSVAAFLDAIFSGLSDRTALYTSPHLVNVCERLRLGGRDVDRATLDRAVSDVMAAEGRAGTELTGFELATAACFLCCADAEVETSIVEVGLGGRLDATNVVSPVISVLTPVGIDHVRFLGFDPVSIAKEKLGITRAQRPLVCARQLPDVTEVVQAYCAAQGSPLLLEGRDFTAHPSPLTPPLSLPGRFQVQNAAVATACALQMGVSMDAILQGLATARWAGRFDLRTVRGQRILFDGAHNVPAVRTLVDAFRHAFQHRPAVLFASRQDKDAEGVLSTLSELASSFVFTMPGDGPGHDPRTLASFARGVPSAVEPDPRAALELLLDSGSTEPHLCCGSFYLVGYYAATEWAP